MKIKNKPKNILMIAPTPFFSDRGCHVRIYEEAKALQEDGNRTTVLTYGLGRDMPGIKTVRILNPFWYKKLSAGPSWTKLFLDCLMILKCKKLLKKEKFDIIHAHLHEGAFIAQKSTKKLPIVLDRQGSLVGELSTHGFIKKGIKQKIFKRLEREIEEKSNIIISSTPYPKAITFWDGVDIFEKKPTIIFVGVLSKYQGADCISYCAKKIPEANFIIVGTGEYNLPKLNNIFHINKIPYESIQIIIKSADLGLSPKIFEGGESNLKLLTYASVGLPVLCYDHPVNKELLGNVGIYAKYKNFDDFCKKIKQFIDGKIKTKSEELIKQAKTKKWEINKLEKIYDEAKDSFNKSKAC